MLWDQLNATYSASDAGSELSIMKSFDDYKMVGKRSIVEQAHEIQFNALQRNLNSLSVSYLMSLWLDALLQSCLLHGGALA
jgi:hypothetical protein